MPFLSFQPSLPPPPPPRVQTECTNLNNPTKSKFANRKRVPTFAIASRFLSLSRFLFLFPSLFLSVHLKLFSLLYSDKSASRTFEFESNVSDMSKRIMNNFRKMKEKRTKNYQINCVGFTNSPYRMRMRTNQCDFPLSVKNSVWANYL